MAKENEEKLKSELETSLFEADQEKLKVAHLKVEVDKAWSEIEGFLDEAVDKFVVGYEKALSHAQLLIPRVDFSALGDH